MHWIPAILILPYFFLIISIYRNLRKIVPFSATVTPRTFISVIIACRNGQNELPSLLECLAMQDYPKDLHEVIFVDDGSSDRTYDILSENIIPGRIKALKNDGKGKKAAIMKGIKESAGSLIITTDADCTMGRSWIRTIAAYFEENNPDMIICPIQLDCKDGFFARFQELEYLSLQGITAGTAMGGNGILCNGGNLAFTRKAYLNHSRSLHFELGTGDDIFLLHSLKSDPGSKIIWLESRDAVVTTSSSSDLHSFLKQRNRWISKWKAYNDRFTIATGILTFTAVLMQLYACFPVFNDILYIWPLLTILTLKSIPDFLILHNTTLRYGKTRLMSWFLPVQLIYPFYVMAVLLYKIVPVKGDPD